MTKPIRGATSWEYKTLFNGCVTSASNNKQEQKKARTFLEDIGVREVGEAEQIETILKQRYSQGSIKPLEQDIERFIVLIEKEPECASLFSEYYIFKLENGKWESQE